MRTIVFDLDGTLVDTAPDLISTLNFVLADEGSPPVAYDDARRMIGGGSRRMIERALIAQGRNVPTAELDRMFGAFITARTLPIARARSPISRPSLSGSPPRAAGLRSAPTSSNGSRLSSSMRSSSAAISRPFAAKILSACKNPIRKSCG